MRRLLVALLALPLLGPVAASADDPPAPVTAPVTITTEAWWTSNPVCSGGVACGTIGATPVDPYPTGTLHVAQNPGAEAARTYLTPGAIAPAGSTLTGAVLTVPLDTTMGDGSQAPDTAHVWVCTTTEAVMAGEALAGTPPQADCGTHVELTYQAGAVPSLTGDLTPLLAALVKPRVSLALVPSTASAQTDVWHVVFHSHAATMPSTAPATLAVTYTPAASTTGAAPTSSAPSAPAPSSSPPSRAAAAPSTSPAAAVVVPPAVVVPVTGGPTLPDLAAAGPDAPEPQVAATDAPTDAGGPVPAPQAVDTTARTVGFAYPGVLLLPLVIGALLLALGRQLTGSMRSRPRS